jgi:hypothetical protein
MHAQIPFPSYINNVGYRIVDAIVYLRIGEKQEQKYIDTQHVILLSEAMRGWILKITVSAS